MSRYAVTDTHDPSDAEVLDRVEDTEREQHCAEFVLAIARGGVQRMAFLAAHRLSVPPARGDALGEWERAILDFAETEGWSGVFAAIARALKEDGR